MQKNLKREVVVLPKLTVKQRNFADEYIISGNATQSYINAGYKAGSRKVAESNGNTLLGNHKVKQYIDQKLKELDSAKIADQKEILQYLTSVMRNELTEEVVVVEGGGGGCSTARKVDKDVSVKDRTKAAELLAKRYGVCKDKADQEEQQARVDKLKGEASRLNSDSDGQLDKLLEAIKDVQ